VVSGGIQADQITAILTETGAHTAHIGGAARTDGAVDAGKVAALRAQIDSI
jgi:tRNA U38,U39,U40 pseudouridine synthase TruA